MHGVHKDKTMCSASVEIETAFDVAMPTTAPIFLYYIMFSN